MVEYVADYAIVSMNEVVRSKKGLGDLFNEENRLRVGWLEATKASLTGFSTTRSSSKLGKAIRLFPKGRLAYG